MSNIVIVGAGVVGQATGKGFAKQGHQITYVDVDPKKIQHLVAQGLQAMTAAEVDWNEQAIVMLTVSTPTIQGRLILDHLKAATYNVGMGLAATDKYINEVHHICEQLGIDSRLVGAVVARSAESMWNPLYGTRGGVPYGGACLPKDTLAFMEFCRNQGWEHEMLAATIRVNEKLEGKIPAVESPEEIDQLLKYHRQVQQPLPAAGYTLAASRPKEATTNGHHTHHFAEDMVANAAG